ncbi:MAG: AAA family ATPase [Thermoplasmata archaeon]
MIDRVVTLTGPHGSGKTTAGRGAAEKLGLHFRSAGTRFREEAARRDLDLARFSRLAEEDPSIDGELDRSMLTVAKPGWLLEGQIIGALCRRAGVPVLYLRLTAREAVRVQRLSERDGTDPATTLERVKAREASEADRYRRYYGIDLARETFDGEVDTSDLSPSAVIDRVTELVRLVASA